MVRILAQERVVFDGLITELGDRNPPYCIYVQLESCVVENRAEQGKVWNHKTYNLLVFFTDVVVFEGDFFGT